MVEMIYTLGVFNPKGFYLLLFNALAILFSKETFFIGAPQVRLAPKGESMSLFPNYTPEMYESGDREILTLMSERYAESVSINQSYWTEADTDTRFFVGDATLYNELYGNLPVNRRKQFNFNRIKRVVNMISGRQRQTRKSIIATPVENADAETADQFSKVLNWVDRQEGISETFSEAVEGSLVTGLNLLQVWVDYRSDPISGTIKVDNCAYNSFLIDPFFRKPDLSDCNYIWKRSFLTKREIVSLLPERSDEVVKLLDETIKMANSSSYLRITTLMSKI